MEQSPAIAALALDFIQQLSAEQSETAVPLSGVLTNQRKLFEPEIEKLQGQIVSHASGDFVVLFRKPFSAVICALSLHRMFAALSQALPELEGIQLRIGVHAEDSPNDDMQAQQRCIETAGKLKEQVPGGSIFISGALVATIAESMPVNLRPVEEHKLAAAVKPFGVFELVPPPLEPLRIKRKRPLAKLQLTLAASLALVITGGAGYGYFFEGNAIEWSSAPWFQTAFEIARQDPDRLIDFSASSASSQTLAPHTLQSSFSGQAERTEQQAKATGLEMPVVRQAQPTPTLLSAAPKELDASTKPLKSTTEPPATIAAEKHQEQPKPKSESARTAAIFVPKPRARPTKPSQPLGQQAEQGAFALPADPDQTALGVLGDPQAAQAEGPVTIVPQQPLVQPQGQSSGVAAVPAGCELLRRAFHGGVLSVDSAAYKLFLKCQRLKINQQREGSVRVAAKPGNQRTNDNGAASGGDTGSGSDSGSGGKSNGRGNGKGK